MWFSTLRLTTEPIGVGGCHCKRMPAPILQCRWHDYAGEEGHHRVTSLANQFVRIAESGNKVTPRRRRKKSGPEREPSHAGIKAAYRSSPDSRFLRSQQLTLHR
jgi:hypothetical protein